MKGLVNLKNIILGMLAHVDAGKTTLSESLLYQSGAIRKLGRVDHGDAFLDFNSQERKRGITIFSKQSQFQWIDTSVTLIDTPGHVDFSTEMERTLQILDYAIVVINALDGIQAHTETIWNLLHHYKIPTFIFVNKMDISHYKDEELLKDMKERLHVNCINFTKEDESFIEHIAFCDEHLLEYFIEHQSLEKRHIIDTIKDRNMFPCFFGSALKMEGIQTLLDGLQKYTQGIQYPNEFGARVYKITRDEQGNRLTHMKITGGTLKVKTVLDNSEKVDQIRIYSGNKFEMINEVKAGMVCAVKGLKDIQVQDGFGIEQHMTPPVLSSYMNYRLCLDDGCDVHTMMQYVKQLSEEDPLLHINYQKHKQEIHIQLMGEIQIEVLKQLILDRFHVHVSFDAGRVVYKETIANAVEGIGHYEPLRHYAEVHVLLKPGEPGSGLQFFSECSEDILDRHWQRLVLSHLEEKEHLGVLTGSPITDIEIYLLTGKAHQKHTKGGDFRQATYRAIRQGLKQAESILLEPYFSYRLEIPTNHVSKAIFDIESMNGDFQIEDLTTGFSVLTGSAPVANIQNYQKDVIAYTKGKGRLQCVFKDYKRCDKQEDIIHHFAYDSESDLDNPTGSIFCTHGAGFYVPWDQVKDYMHVHSEWGKQEIKKTQYKVQATKKISDAELKNIYEKTYGPIKQRVVHKHENKKIDLDDQQIIELNKTPKCLLVDGYNVIHDWEDLKDLANENLEAARMKLINVMNDYQGYKKCELILVFDAYKVENNMGETYKHDNIYVVYTKTAQTADMYIERATHKLAKDYHVVVATSDGLEQLIAIGQGAMRLSSRQLKLEVEAISKQSFQDYERNQKRYRTFLLEDIKNYNEE